MFAGVIICPEGAKRQQIWAKRAASERSRIACVSRAEGRARAQRPEGRARVATTKTAILMGSF